MKRTTAFWAGIGAAMAATNLWQDIEGQQGMLELVQHHWVTGRWTVPVAVAGLLACSWMWLLASKEDRK